MIGSVNSGGGGGNVFAFIVVTYPAGSVCTCTDGTKTLTAKDTTGSWVFEIPYAGTWTVSCTDGESTKSKQVTISTKGQGVEVELNYRLYLYNSGNECTDVTGGWLSKRATTGGSGATVSVTRSTDSIALKVQSSGGGGNPGLLYTANAINLSGYSKMFVDRLNSANTNAANDMLGIWTAASSALTSNPVAKTSISSTDKSARHLYELDISEYQSIYYVGITGNSGSSTQTTTMYSCYLE